MSSAERDALIDRIGKILGDWLRKDSHVVVGPILDVIKERETAMREECEEWMDDLQAQADMYSSAQKANDVHSWAVDLITMIAATKAAIRGTEQDGGDNPEPHNESR